jgi:hypothetical protein
LKNRVDLIKVRQKKKKSKVKDLNNIPEADEAEEVESTYNNQEGIKKADDDNDS